MNQSSFIQNQIDVFIHYSTSTKNYLANYSDSNLIWQIISLKQWTPIKETSILKVSFPHSMYYFLNGLLIRKQYIFCILDWILLTDQMRTIKVDYFLFILQNCQECVTFKKISLDLQLNFFSTTSVGIRKVMLKENSNASYTQKI